MPALKDVYNFLEDRYARRQARKKRLDEQVLPEGFTRQVFDAAVREANHLEGVTDAIDAALERLAVELQAAKADVRAAYPVVKQPAVIRGDIISGEFRKIQAPDRGARLRTPAALKIEREKVRPIQRQIAALKAQKAACDQDTAHLRKIAQRALLGEVSLIHFLSDTWRARLEIGGAVLGKLPPAAREVMARDVLYVDAAGNPLPGEALDGQGAPDLPPAKVRHEQTV